MVARRAGRRCSAPTACVRPCASKQGQQRAFARALRNRWVKAAAEKAAADRAAFFHNLLDKCGLCIHAPAAQMATWKAISDRKAISDLVTPPPPPQTLAKSLATSRFLNIYNQPERRPDQLYALMTTERHRAPLSATHRYGLPERSSGRMRMRVSAPCACM